MFKIFQISPSELNLKQSSVTTFHAPNLYSGNSQYWLGNNVNLGYPSRFRTKKKLYITNVSIEIEEDWYDSWSTGNATFTFYKESNNSGTNSGYILHTASISKNDFTLYNNGFLPDNITPQNEAFIEISELNDTILDTNESLAIKVTLNNTTGIAGGDLSINIDYNY